MTKETQDERVSRVLRTALTQQVQASQIVYPDPTAAPSKLEETAGKIADAIIEAGIKEYPSHEKAVPTIVKFTSEDLIHMKSGTLPDHKTLRDDFAIQMLAALVNASRLTGTLPNADMMANEAVKYADALIDKLSRN